jgi:serine/threonine-protein kinase HipA
MAADRNGCFTLNWDEVERIGEQIGPQAPSWSPEVDLHIQVHHSGVWHDAARVNIANPALGISAPSLTNYEFDYVLGDWNMAELAAAAHAIDAHALSIALPVGLDPYRAWRWPAFLVDLLPQGRSRRRIADSLRSSPNDSRLDLPLLLSGAGNSIGNIRVYEAWQEEQQRAKEVTLIGLTKEDILETSDRFRDTAETCALVATGSAGVQGEWPKLLLTRSAGGLWYPDSLVPDDGATEHVLVKMVRDNKEVDAKILAAEAAYLEVARAFGLRVGKAATHGDGKLIIPRFDRVLRADGLMRVGQESLISALGHAEFSPIITHEACLALIQRVATNPAEETAEYLLRDVLNIAMGNPDNHGRNTALQKFEDGTITLSPLYDFAPMRLDEATIARSTKWRIMEGRDFDPDWAKVAEVAAGTVIELEKLRRILAQKAPFVRDLPKIAKSYGVPEDVIERALSRHNEVAHSLEILGT